GPYLFFFFSSRRRHTRFSRDWSSDVCSSDLLRRPSGSARILKRPRSWPPPALFLCPPVDPARRNRKAFRQVCNGLRPCLIGTPDLCRSEERRVGKECSLRGWPVH